MLQYQSSLFSLQPFKQVAHSLSPRQASCNNPRPQFHDCTQNDITIAWGSWDSFHKKTICILLQCWETNRLQSYEYFRLLFLEWTDFGGQHHSLFKNYFFVRYKTTNKRHSYLALVFFWAFEGLIGQTLYEFLTFVILSLARARLRAPLKVILGQLSCSLAMNFCRLMYDVMPLLSANISTADTMTSTESNLKKKHNLGRPSIYNDLI